MIPFVPAELFTSVLIGVGGGGGGGGGGVCRVVTALVVPGFVDTTKTSFCSHSCCCCCTSTERCSSQSAASPSWAGAVSIKCFIRFENTSVCWSRRPTSSAMVLYSWCKLVDCCCCCCWNVCWRFVVASFLDRFVADLSSI